MSELTYAALIRQEQEYFHRLEEASHLDPTARIDKGLLTSIRRMEDLDTGRLADFASLCEEARVSASPAERIAIRRDCDKVFGYFSYHKSPVPVEICGRFTDRSAPDPYPRANLYEYAFGSDPGRDGHLYTGDDRERALLGVLTESIGLAHRAAHLLIEARGELREHGDSHGSLAAAAEAVQAAAKPMARTYKAVTPRFFRLEMTRRWRHVDIGGVAVQGPNVSHNAHLHVDRLAAGSYAEMTAANPAMAHVYEERQSTMPGFLRRLLRYIDEIDGGESVLELSRGSADRAAATMILKTLGKTKVMHKSYADKGLAAAGKTLSPDMPDLLTDNITFVLAPLHRNRGR